MGLARKDFEPLPLIGGVEPVVIRAEDAGGAQPAAFLDATFLPGRGMNLIQIRGRIPELGEIDLFHAPALSEVSRQLDGGPGDFMGVHSFRFGGAFLVPFSNRIRGRLLADGCTLETEILGRKVQLPADWQGKHTGAEKCAIHGLILASPMTIVRQGPGFVAAELNAGDFGGHWLSEAMVRTEANLRENELELTVTARNEGKGALPMGIGWHPYFALPSGRRDQARVRMSAHERVLVNNYDDVFPTGEVVSVAGTPYDFTGPDGAALGSQYFDDCLRGLKKNPQGEFEIEVLDPAAKYGIRITALSPEVQSIQIYSPPDAAFVVVEPQFNLADPFSDVWPKGFDTGMILLGPGQSASWRVRLELLVMT